MFRFFLSFGLIFQIAALVHFIRRRPDSFWLWIILFGGGLGSLVYLAVEAIPDLGNLRGDFRFLQNRSRRRQLEWLIQENPAPANLEELAELYHHDKRWTEARTLYDRALAIRSDSLDPFYRRAQCSIALADYAAAVPDLERVVLAEANFDFYRAATQLARCYASLGDVSKAGALLEQVTRCSTLTEAQLQYALFLGEQQRNAEALEWIDRILAKRPTMPGFQRRNERPLFRQATSLRKKLLSETAAAKP
jgi:hypothetical protein